MSETNCRRWVDELVECARAHTAPRRELQNHLQACATCAARWASEQNLSAHFQALRETAIVSRPVSAHREQILREFAQTRRRTSHPFVRWALAAAAVLVLSLGTGLVWRAGGLHPRGAGGDTTGSQASTGTSQAEGLDVEDGFVRVPFAPPLAEGEFVRVVHAELGPVELARMGLIVDDLENGEVPAEVIVGEDGFPRAVRLSETSEF